MRVKQLSVFIENVSGRMAAVVRALARHGINLRAFSMAETEDYGILRVIVNNPEAAQQVMREEGFTARLTDVIAVEVPDHPSGLAEVLDILEHGGVNIEYLYAFTEKYGDSALVVFRVEDADAAADLLTGKGVHVVSNEEVIAM